MKQHLARIAARMFRRVNFTAMKDRLVENRPKSQLRLDTLESRTPAGTFLDILYGTLSASAGFGPDIAFDDFDRLLAPVIRVDSPIGTGSSVEDVSLLGYETDRLTESKGQVTEGDGPVSPAESWRGVGLDDGFGLDDFHPIAAGWSPFAAYGATEPTPANTGEPATVVDSIALAGFTNGGQQAVPTAETMEEFASPLLVAPTMGPGDPPEEYLVGAMVKEVTFSGDGLIAIEADPGDPVYLDPPHWLDTDLNGVIDVSGDRALPLGYSRGDTAKVSAHFVGTFADIRVLPPDVVPSEPMVRGDGPGSYDVPSTPVSDSGSYFVLAPTALAAPFADHVDYFAGFGITWEFSYAINTSTGQRVWEAAGSSSNQLYVTLGDPVGELPVYHTVIHNGTVYATGATNSLNYISWTWTLQFAASRDVKKHNGVALHYYKDWDTTSVQKRTLLQTKDGQCGAWVMFFLSQLQTNGINRPDWYVSIKPKVAGDWLAIADWTFVAPGSSGIAGYPYANTLANPANKHEVFAKQNQTWSYTWPTAEMQDKNGIPGQNTANPLSLFDKHIVAKIDGVYYDPSYGLKHDSLQTWETSSVKGFAKPVELGTNPQTYRWVSKSNGDGLDVEETVWPNFVIT